MKIGFIGQGWVGKNYADDFKRRGYDIIRYSLEKKYIKNEDQIKKCDVVFIAVPTPTVKNVFKDDALREVIKKVGEGKIAVIKSTILPGTTESIQKENPGIYILHSPEFLREKTAKYDTSNPDRNIIGIPKNNATYKAIAKKVMKLLPRAPFEVICSAREAEIVKYANNSFLYLKVVYMNLLYDVAMSLDCNWETVKKSLKADPRIGSSHLDPILGGRGAGGHCFIKDFSAFKNFYGKNVNDVFGMEFLERAERKNLELLINSKKDMDLLREVYGDGLINNF